MNTTLENYVPNTTRRLHPVILATAIAVLVFSLLGIASLTGLMPLAHSEKNGVSEAVGAQHRNAILCASCGVVEAVRVVSTSGHSSGLGAVAGGITGAILGNQVGRGNGNTAMTVIGAAGGAYAGNSIEQNMNHSYSYRISVRMDDGSYRSLSQVSAPTVAVGERVRVVSGTVIAQQ